MGGKCPHRKVKKRRFSHKSARLTNRYFSTVAVRDEHFKTKRHKKRVKQMMGPAPHTQLDAELAAGMGMPDNGPKLMIM
ncbi:hypothetical protein RJ641_024963 [Dillenia turbinata]|uniref:Uncharacterized protein n=1 Tax=Dillenia turbinata TaxID=194707 RepID=A0AAN8ZN17_9MAGN